MKASSELTVAAIDSSDCDGAAAVRAAEQLARELGGDAQIEVLSENATALLVAMPPTLSGRFEAALSLSGATTTSWGLADGNRFILVVTHRATSRHRERR
jgi:hypothetical protein